MVIGKVFYKLIVDRFFSGIWLLNEFEVNYNARVTLLTQFIISTKPPTDELCKNIFEVSLNLRNESFHQKF